MPTNAQVPAREVTALGTANRAGPQPAQRHPRPWAVINGLVGPFDRLSNVGAANAQRVRPRLARDVEQRRSQKAGGPGHLSTPVTTTPRMKARWARKNTTTGTAMVINAAAWISVGWVTYSALNCWMAMGSVCRLGLPER